MRTHKKSAPTVGTSRPLPTFMKPSVHVHALMIRHTAAVYTPWKLNIIAYVNMFDATMHDYGHTQLKVLSIGLRATISTL